MASPAAGTAAGTALWACALAAAQVYAIVFLARAVRTLKPALWARLFGRRGGGGGGGGLCGRFSGRGAEAGAGMRRSKSGEVWSAHLTRAGRGRPLALSWEGLGCSYDTPEGRKTVLQDVSGAAAPCELQALMGPSGAGKSTLLDILAARKTLGHLTGSVSVNGAPRDAARFLACTAYVPQEDGMAPVMTVGETCALHAALRLPRGTGRAERAERVDEALASMNMLHARDTLVGGVLPGGLLLRGISGGERRRVSVAIGCLAQPSILFLDEPTSGLDACSALAVVEHLRDRARDSGLTVVASIHQPRASVWALFHSCSILAGGMLLYTGPCSGLLPWFEGSLGLGPWEAGAHGAVADWAIDLVNVGFGTVSRGRTIQGRDELAAAAASFAAHYRQLQAKPPPASGDAGGGADDTARVCDRGLSAATPSPPPLGRASGGDSGGGDGLITIKDGSPAGGAGGPEPRGPSWRTQFRVLLWREMLSIMRNPLDVAGRMLLFAWVGVFVGAIFWQLDTDASGLRNRVTLLFTQTLLFLLMPYCYQSLYSADKAHFIADSSANLFQVSAYYAAKSLAIIPFMVATVLANVAIVYGMTGLRLEPASLAVNATASMLVYMLAQQVQALATILAPNQDAAFLISIAWSVLNLYQSNFVMRFTDMVKNGWLANLRFLSASNYAFAAMAKAEFAGASGSCGDGLSPDLLATLRALLPRTPPARLGLLESALRSPGPGCVMDFDAIVQYFSLVWPAWAYLLALAAYGLAVHGLTLAALLLLARRERR